MTELIPAPRTVVAGSGEVRLTEHSRLYAGPATEGVGRWLRTVLWQATGLPLREGREPEGADGGGAAGDGADGDGITLRIGPGLGPEEYRLVSDRGGVLVEGGSAAGVLHGAQTLRQLLGPDAFRRAPLDRDRAWTVPHVTVEDGPRFRWRGLMLDVARHFMPKEGVLRYLDLMAAHKLNVLHLHLTDDQGWRIEIKRYPKLTGTGSWRARTKIGHRASPLWDDRPHGGHYTQDDIREIVAYAAERHIGVVPEIDVPGHSQAAIAAYPELGNTDVVDTAALTVWDTWGINPNVLAPTDRTLRFYEGVLEEVLELFPADAGPFSSFVHIGGDECVKDQWRASETAQKQIQNLGLADEDALQAWFVAHFDSWLTARGRRLIGWDEILQGGLAPGAAVSSWRGYAGGVTAAPRGSRRGHVPRAAGVPGPPAGRGPRRAGADRLRAHPGGRLPVRARARRADAR
ncbi:hexosaminidase [Streptomyces calvus]